MHPAAFPASIAATTMSTPPKDVHTSDTEGGERPLRERLRNASIKSAKQPTDTLATTEPEPEKARAKLQRKRSHEDVESVEDEPAHKSRQARKNKRSRENSPDEKVAEQSGKRKSSELERDDEPVAVEISQPSVPSTSTVTSIETDNLTKSDESPKSKRSRVDDKTTADTASSATSDAKATIEPEGKTGQEQTKPAIKIPAGSGFANTSAASPFASLATSKSPSEQPQPTTSAFASSAFGALAGSSTSAFGALGQNKTLSSFASPGTTPAPGEDAAKPAPKQSAFGDLAAGASPFATAGSSGFGSGASGFGKLGNGFGGGFGSLGGSKLTNFASSGTPGVIGSSTKTGITAFGAPAEDREEQSGDEEDNEAGVKSPKLIVDEDKKDERFFEQESKSCFLYLSPKILTVTQSKPAKKAKPLNTHAALNYTTLSTRRSGRSADSVFFVST